MDFDKIYAMALHHHGDAVEADLPVALGVGELESLGEDRHLAQMSLCIFRAGFSWSVVANKWPGFEAAFEGFDPDELAFWPDERWEALARDERIIRNGTKIRAVRENAQFICSSGSEQGGYSRFIAHWPKDDPVGLWRWLKQHGSRLGGATGPMYLRGIGKDTFILSADVVRALEREQVFVGNPQTKANLTRIQDAFLQLQDQSGRPFCEISRILARSIG